VRLYGLRQWVEQGYEQVKHELGWADFQVRADRAIRRHWALVRCAFSEDRVLEPAVRGDLRHAGDPCRGPRVCPSR
jgi:hypothetical protein